MHYLEVPRSFNIVMTQKGESRLYICVVVINRAGGDAKEMDIDVFEGV